MGDFLVQANIALFQLSLIFWCLFCFCFKCLKRVAFNKTLDIHHNKRHNESYSSSSITFLNILQLNFPTFARSPKLFSLNKKPDDNTAKELVFLWVVALRPKMI